MRQENENEEAPNEEAPKPIRCSRLPRVMKCSASLRAPEVEIDYNAPEAQRGRCVHAVMADVARADLSALPDLDPYLAKWPIVDGDEIERLARNGLRIWKRLRMGFRTLGVEKKLMAPPLTGTPDVFGVPAEPEIVIIDWKSDWEPRDYNDQLRGYAWLVIRNYSPADPPTRIKLVTAWLRYGEYDSVVMSWDDFSAWFARLEKQLKSDVFSPGEHCTFCGIEHECAALTALTRANIAIFRDIEDGPLLPTQYAAVFPQYQMALKALKKFHALLKSLAKSAGGELAVSENEVLRIETQVQKVIRPSSASMQVLQALFAEQLDERRDLSLIDLLSEVLTIGKGKLEKLVKSSAAKGRGAARVRELYRGLEEANVMTSRHVEKLVLRKKEADSDGR